MLASVLEFTYAIVFHELFRVAHVQNRFEECPLATRCT
jgi:hypothetical protein